MTMRDTVMAIFSQNETHCKDCGREKELAIHRIYGEIKVCRNCIENTKGEIINE